MLNITQRFTSVGTIMSYDTIHINYIELNNIKLLNKKGRNY